MQWQINRIRYIPYKKSQQPGDSADRLQIPADAVRALPGHCALGGDGEVAMFSMGFRIVSTSGILSYQRSYSSSTGTGIRLNFSQHENAPGGCTAGAAS